MLAPCAANQFIETESVPKLKRRCRGGKRCQKELRAFYGRESRKRSEKPEAAKAVHDARIVALLEEKVIVLLEKIANAVTTPKRKRRKQATSAVALECQEISQNIIPCEWCRSGFCSTHGTFPEYYHQDETGAFKTMLQYLTPAEEPPGLEKGQVPATNFFIGQSDSADARRSSIESNYDHDWQNARSSIDRNLDTEDHKRSLEKISEISEAGAMITSLFHTLAAKKRVDEMRLEAAGEASRLLREEKLQRAQDARRDDLNARSRPRFSKEKEVPDKPNPIRDQNLRILAKLSEQQLAQRKRDEEMIRIPNEPFRSHADRSIHGRQLWCPICQTGPNMCEGCDDWEGLGVFR